MARFKRLKKTGRRRKVYRRKYGKKRQTLNKRVKRVINNLAEHKFSSGGTVAPIPISALAGYPVPIISALNMPSAFP